MTRRLRGGWRKEWHIVHPQIHSAPPGGAMVRRTLTSHNTSPRGSQFPNASIHPSTESATTTAAAFTTSRRSLCLSLSLSLSLSLTKSRQAVSRKTPAFNAPERTCKFKRLLPSSSPTQRSSLENSGRPWQQNARRHGQTDY